MQPRKNQPIRYSFSNYIKAEHKEIVGAIGRGEIEKAKALIDSHDPKKVLTDEHGYFVIHIAALQLQYDLVKYILKKWPNLVDKDSWTSLSQVIQCTQFEKFKGDKDNYYKMALVLMHHGARTTHPSVLTELDELQPNNEMTTKINTAVNAAKNDRKLFAQLLLAAGLISEAALEFAKVAKLASPDIDITALEPKLEVKLEQKSEITHSMQAAQRLVKLVEQNDLDAMIYIAAIKNGLVSVKSLYGLYACCLLQEKEQGFENILQDHAALIAAEQMDKLHKKTKALSQIEYKDPAIAANTKLLEAAAYLKLAQTENDVPTQKEWASKALTILKENIKLFMLDVGSRADLYQLLLTLLQREDVDRSVVFNTTLTFMFRELCHQTASPIWTNEVVQCLLEKIQDQNSWESWLKLFNQHFGAIPKCHYAVVKAVLQKLVDASPLKNAMLEAHARWLISGNELAEAERECVLFEKEMKALPNPRLFSDVRKKLGDQFSRDKKDEKTAYEYYTKAADMDDAEAAGKAVMLQFDYFDKAVDKFIKLAEVDSETCAMILVYAHTIKEENVLDTARSGKLKAVFDKLNQQFNDSDFLAVNQSDIWLKVKDIFIKQPAAYPFEIADKILLQMLQLKSGDEKFRAELQGFYRHHNNDKRLTMLNQIASARLLLNSTAPFDKFIKGVVSQCNDALSIENDIAIDILEAAVKNKITQLKIAGKFTSENQVLFHKQVKNIKSATKIKAFEEIGKNIIGISVSSESSEKECKMQAYYDEKEAILKLIELSEKAFFKSPGKIMYLRTKLALSTGDEQDKKTAIEYIGKQKQDEYTKFLKTVLEKSNYDKTISVDVYLVSENPPETLLKYIKDVTGAVPLKVYRNDKPAAAPSQPVDSSNASMVNTSVFFQMPSYIEPEGNVSGRMVELNSLQLRPTRLSPSNNGE